jgi:hypothetical protein
MQCYTIRLFPQNALHVSGGSSTHHQKLKLYIQRQVFVYPLLLTFAIVEELDLVKPVPAVTAIFAIVEELELVKPVPAVTATFRTG